MTVWTHIASSRNRANVLTHLTLQVDIPLLYQPVTPEAIDNAYKFYEMWWEAPGAVKALFHVALGLPLVALLIKLHKWNESAVFFDGSCIGE